MANRPEKDPTPRKSAAKKAAPSRPAAKKAASKNTAKKASSRTARDYSSTQAPPEDKVSAASPGNEGIGAETTEALKQGFSRFLSKSRDVIAAKGPQVLDTLEKVTHKAIDGTAKGVNTFEKATNELEGKITKGLKDLLSTRRKDSDNDGPSNSSGPRAR